MDPSLEERYEARPTSSVSDAAAQEVMRRKITGESDADAYAPGGKKR